MTQRCTLKTVEGEFKVQMMMLKSPTGRIFMYDVNSGIMSYDSAQGRTFEELLANSWIQEEDRIYVKALAVALLENKNFLRNLEKFK